MRRDYRSQVVLARPCGSRTGPARRTDGYRMSWTDERIATLTKMWEGGATASQIADELGGVSRNAVIGKAHRLGLKARPSPVKANEPKPAAPVRKEPEARPPAKAAAPARSPVKSAAPAAPEPEEDAGDEGEAFSAASEIPSQPLPNREPDR